MPFTVIKGMFMPEVGRPDGDSIRFKPHNPEPLFRLRRRGFAPKLNANNGTIQLRFEGIDTLESRANAEFSSAATRSNLALCGVPNGLDAAEGYILTNQIGPNGRPIVFVFSGRSDFNDGESIFLDTSMLERSVNFQQLAAGHAYPLFYDTLYDDLRETMAEKVRELRAAPKHIWLHDQTHSGVHYQGRASLALMPPIFPKLWRRLESYSRDNDIGEPHSLGEFRGYLQSLRDERVVILSENRITGFDNLVEVIGNQVSLRYLPEDVVIISVR